MAAEEIILDPGFDDPNAWNDSPFPVTVAGSQLTVLNGYTLFFGATPPIPAEIGATYIWELDVAQISPIGAYGVSLGGVTFWQAPKAAGVHTGSFVATSEAVLTFVHLTGMSMNAIYNGLSVKKVTGPPPDIIPFNMRINKGKSVGASINKNRPAELHINRSKSYNGHIDQQHDAVAHVATNPQFNPEL